MESPPTTVSNPMDFESSSQDTDSSSISPSDSASNYGGGEEMEENPEDLNCVPHTARRTAITNRLLDLQIKSNQLTIMFNEESTYQKDKNNESANVQRSEWIAKCIEVINDTQKMQSDIIEHHLSKHKNLEDLDYIASLKLIEEWMEQVAAIWARTHHQLRLYAFLQDNNDSEDAAKLLADVRKLFCLLIQESFWVMTNWLQFFYDYNSRYAIQL